MNDNGDEVAKILVIDDSQEILDFFDELLPSMGYKVFSEASGESGLSLAILCDFDLILLDIVLPQIDGDDVLMKLKQMHPNTPVIMITGNDDDDKAHRCMQLGATDFITKPFDLEYLRTSIQTALLPQGRA